jgi:hypothetical protein
VTAAARSSGARYTTDPPPVVQRRPGLDGEGDRLAGGQIRLQRQRFRRPGDSARIEQRAGDDAVVAGDIRARQRCHPRAAIGIQPQRQPRDAQAVSRGEDGERPQDRALARRAGRGGAGQRQRAAVRVKDPQIG